MKSRKTFTLFLSLVMMLTMVGILPASADENAVIDGATANGRCATSYLGVSGPDQLSNCQWDMAAIQAGEATHVNLSIL